MAIGRISGSMLKANLDRQGVDLSIETDLLYVDVNNDRIGINEAVPTTSLHVDNVTIENNEIRSTSSHLDLGATPADITIGGGTSGYFLQTDGAGNLVWAEVVTSSAGTDLTLGTPDDSSLYPPGAITDWTYSTTITDAIDDLNEAMENVRNDTFVKEVDFVADQTVGGAGLTVTLTITTVGNPNQYEIDWGDGNTDTTTDSTPTHTYSTNTGSPFTVTVTARNTSGSGTGSEANKTRISYIIIYTADPVVSFAAYAASSGGSPITFWDDGATVYFENTTTNTSGATVQYTWDWGDSESNDVITGDSDPGGVGGGRLAHTFTASTEQEVQRIVSLTVDSHSTAQPSVIPVDDDDTFEIYDTHTPSLTLDVTTGINEQSTSGLPVTITNTTENTIGSYATYGIYYKYTFGDGSTQNVNVGSGAAGDTSGTIGHTYTLSSSDQANGIAQDYTGKLEVYSNHTSSPFQSSNFTVHVEPDIRATISGTAITVSDRNGDNQYDVYDGVGYDGVNRALVRVTNTTQNGDDYVYDWGDTSSNDTPTEDGSSAGSIGAVIDHDYTGESIGNLTLNFTANGTPDITAQTDTDSIVFQLNSVPSAPAGLSSKSITLSDSYQGTLPRLAAGFADNSNSNPLSAGADLTTTTARRFTSGTIDTSVAENAYNGVSGTVTAIINGIDSGNTTFSASLNENGTFSTLVITDQRDANDTISSSTYPTGFYQTFDSKITQSLTSYSVGVNDERIEHSTTGNTNYVTVVRDDMTVLPSFGSIGTLSEHTAGTYRYVSGIPYYNTGSPKLTVSGVTVNNLVGQAYTNQSNIVEIDPGTNYESTSSTAIQNEDYTYAQIDGSVSFLTGGIPNANTGTSSAYALGDLTVDITTSNVRTIESPQIRVKNVNGTSSYSNFSEKVQVHSSSQSGVNELIIPVADALGNGTYTDDGIRITDFLAATTDTPSYTGSTNFYTNAPYSESSDPGVEGTQEATVRLGVLEHNTEDYSTGFLPTGPDRSADTGTQYFTFAFRRQVVANFDIDITSSTGITGMWIAAPGTGIDSASGLNGWLDTTGQYAGSGVPGSNTGSGGNGSDNCALTGADVVPTGSSLSGGYTMTLGAENMSNATGNVVLVRIALASGETVTSIGIGEAS
jgi:hypothetical protein